MPNDAYILKKWHIAHVWFPDLLPPHHKYCICICPERHWYFLINSAPPYTRRARDVVVVIDNFELHCIQHTSYVDTTTLVCIPAEQIIGAIAVEEGRRGALPPFLRQRICEAVDTHGVLTPDEIAAVLND
jgi:hypothetical protein